MAKVIRFFYVGARSDKQYVHGCESPTFTEGATLFCGMHTRAGWLYWLKKSTTPTGRPLCPKCFP